MGVGVTGTDHALRMRTYHGGGWYVLIAALVVLILVFVIRRVAVDVPNVSAGTAPDDGPDWQYALHPVVAYAHIAVAVPYILLAPLQLTRSFRVRHYRVHRLVGRTTLTLALISTAAAIVLGGRFAFGGAAESIAAVLFGSWFAVCLMLAFLAIRRGDVVQHRPWMIRAFVVGLGVVTIRLWIGLFSALGAFTFEDRFAIAFCWRSSSTPLSASC
jgi:uncharacterized membrane protein